MWGEYLPTYTELRLELKIIQQNEEMGRAFGQWYKMRQDLHIYECLNQQHVDALANFLKPYKKILEVGAGNGRLSHFLRERLPDASIVAIDNGSWEIEPLFSVEKMEIDEALEKYQPEIVISCWMPYQADWTPMFRACSSVQGYILIGETDGGCCGTETLWFGEDGENPGYEKDGFTRYDLDELSKWQLCRTDYHYDLDSDWRHSSTVFFKRGAE